MKLQRYSLAWILVLCLFQRANGQESDVPRPKQGRTIQLLQKHINVKPTKDGPMRIEAEVPITVTVLQADAQRTVIRWKRGVLKMTDIDCDLVRKNPALKQVLLKGAAAQAGPMMTAMDNVTFDVILSPAWECQGLANYDEVLAAMVKSLDAVDELRRKNGGKPIETAFRDSILNRATLERIAPQEALNYLTGNRYSLQRGATKTLRGTAPLPIGGESIPCQVKVAVEKANDADGLLVVRTESTTNMDDGVAAIKQMIAKTPGGKPLSPEDEAALRDMHVELTAEYHIDPDTGWARMGRQKASTKTKDAEQSTEVLWTVRSEGR